MYNFWKGRLFVYLLILAPLFAIFAKQPRAATPGSFTHQLAFYIEYFGFPLLVWVVIFELLYRLYRLLRWLFYKLLSIIRTEN